MIYRDLATHHTSTTYDLVYIEQRSKGRGITFPEGILGARLLGVRTSQNRTPGRRKGFISRSVSTH
jgi:hypothetical protein